MIDRYSYEELKNAALSVNSTQKNIDDLGEWFERFGDMFWNGESWTIDDNNIIKPVYKQTEDGEYIVIGYELK